MKCATQLPGGIYDVFSSYNFYGCWCGKGGDGKPVDEIDQCCKDHDLCYDALNDHKVCNVWVGQVYWLPYEFQCKEGQVDLPTASGNTSRFAPECKKASTECGMGACKCDVQFASCIRKFKFEKKKVCPETRLVCGNVHWFGGGWGWFGGHEEEKIAKESTNSTSIFKKWFGGRDGDQVKNSTSFFDRLFG